MEEDSNDVNSYDYNNFDGMGYNSPSFSNSTDIEKIKRTVSKSKAEQVNRRKSKDGDDEESSNKKDSDLKNKNDLDEKNELNKKDEKKDGPLDKNNGKAENGSNNKDKLNPLQKIKGKLSFVKMKAYLAVFVIGIVVLVGMFIMGFFVSLFGGAESDDSDDTSYEEIETVNDESTDDETDVEEASDDETTNNEAVDNTEESDNAEEGNNVEDAKEADSSRDNVGYEKIEQYTK